MRRISWCLVLFTTEVAHADLPNTAPIYGSDSLESVGAALEQSASETRQNDAQREEAERRLRENGDAISIAVGSTATSYGATMLIGGSALASSANWGADSCTACLPSLILLIGGFQLTVLGVVNLLEYGSLHQTRHHRRYVSELVSAMSHPSIEAASTLRRHRLTLGWTLLASGILVAGSSVALFAMGHQDGFDDGVREAIAAVNAYAGGWLVAAGSGELAAKWENELALAPTRGGAMITYERRW